MRLRLRAVRLEQQHAQRHQKGQQSLRIQHERRAHVVRHRGRKDPVQPQPHESLNELMNGEENRQRCEKQFTPVLHLRQGDHANRSPRHRCPQNSPPLKNTWPVFSRAKITPYPRQTTKFFFCPSLGMRFFERAMLFCAASCTRYRIHLLRRPLRLVSSRRKVRAETRPHRKTFRFAPLQGET